MEKRLRELAQTQEEMRMAVRILVDIMWKMGNYLYNHSDNPTLKSHLKDLGEELRSIKEPRKR